MLESLKEKYGYQAFGLDIFQFLGTLAIRHGNKGSAVTDYAWEWYQKRGYSLTEAAIVEHIDGSEFGLWLDAQHRNPEGWTRVHNPRVKRPKVSRKAAAKIAARVTEAQAAKVIGDKIRADSADMAERQADYAVVFHRQQDTQDIWRRISKGEFPLGEPAFKAEMYRLAMLRATVAAR